MSGIAISAVVIALVVLFSVISIGIPLAFGLATSGLIGCYLIGGWTEVQGLGYVAFEHLNSFSMIAVPLFILMGNVLLEHKIGEEIYSAIYTWVGHFKGGLAIASTFTCAAFGFMCGSSPATAATVGSVVLGEMEKKGYNRALATGSVAAAGTLASMIPPSVIMVMYAIIALNVSMGDLFIAGIIPGIILACLFSIAIYVIVWFRPSLAPIGTRSSWRERMRTLPNLLPVVLLFIIIIGGIFFGIWSAIEAGAAGTLACILLVGVNKRLSCSSMWKAAKSTMQTSVMIYMIIVGANILAKFFFIIGFHDWLHDLVFSFNLKGWVVVLLMGFIMMLLGMVFDVIALLIIVVPVFLPILQKLGYDPVWFGIMVIAFSEMALITPPVGVNLFVIQSVAPPGTTLLQVSLGAMPFVAMIWVFLVIILIFPQVVLWLPAMMR
ncbi:MAG: TRAP transporter large permease [Syntrophales bacterium]